MSFHDFERDLRELLDKHDLKLASPISVQMYDSPRTEYRSWPQPNITEHRTIATFDIEANFRIKVEHASDWIKERIENKP